MLREPKIVDTTRASDVWFLLTDGQIGSDSVRDLTQMAIRNQLMQIPVVLMIVGTLPYRPSILDISVAITLFASASHAMIVF